ncbi:MAG TPA: hypothetical protein VFZ42_15165 [Chitinophagaceae bacterium]
MVLLANLLSSSDFLYASLCVIVLMMIMTVIVKKYKSEDDRHLFMRAFYFKMICTIAYTCISTFYYKYGDTEMYYVASQQLRLAVLDDFDNLSLIYRTMQVNVRSPLMLYFMYLDSPYPVFEAMHSPANFLIPKLGLPFALIFNNSYLCIAMSFSFFALGGAIRLYKFFVHYFPTYRKEVAFATLFLPSVGYWSSGLLKDSICFGCVGFLTYAFLNIFILKRKYLYSIIWILVSGVLLFLIKPYILLALVPALIIWLFIEFNKFVENKTLKRILTVMLLVVGAGIGLFMINYLSSDESLQQYRFDTIAESSESQRKLYEDFAAENSGSYYSVKSSNPVILFLNGIIATFFRPFPWEVNGVTALFSALESMLFLYLTIYVIIKIGIVRFFKNIFSNSVLMMCFIFSIVFAAAIGSTALNFGSLSRYKIPCLPFFIIMVFVLFRQAKLSYPGILRKILGYKPQTRRFQKHAY